MSEKRLPYAFEAGFYESRIETALGQLEAGLVEEAKRSLREAKADCIRAWEEERRG